jgi:hypothetical protein
MASCLVAVVADRFDRTTLFGFLALRLFFRAARLFIDVGIAAVLIASEVGRGGFAAKIAIDALIVHVVLARDAIGVFVCDVSHKFLVGIITARMRKDQA